jgi:transcriptional regulator with XRE-family HTH domain
MRNNLKEARKAKGMTQQAVADYLQICAPHYKNIESGKRCGSFEIWDKLEDLFTIHQRTLRWKPDTHHDTKDNQ